MSDLGFNVTGLIIAVVALAPALTWFRYRLPSVKLPGILAQMKETRRDFDTGLQEGLFPDKKDLYDFHLNIWAVDFRLGEVTAEVYASKSWVKDVKNWHKGLSGRIDVLSEELTDIQARLARAQSSERKRLAEAGYPAQLAASSVSQKYPRHYSPPPTPLPSSSASYQGLEHHNSMQQSELATVAPAMPTIAEPERVSVSPSPGMACDSIPLPSTPHRPSTVGDPAYHSVSDADLKRLLTLAFSSSCCSHENCKDQRAKRRDILLQFGRQLFGPDVSLALPEVVSPTRHTERTHETASVSIGSQDTPSQDTDEAAGLTALSPELPGLGLVEDVEVESDEHRREE